MLIGYNVYQYSLKKFTDKFHRIQRHDWGLIIVLSNQTNFVLVVGETRRWVSIYTCAKSVSCQVNSKKTFPRLTTYFKNETCLMK